MIVYKKNEKGELIAYEEFRRLSRNSFDNGDPKRIDMVDLVWWHTYDKFARDPKLLASAQEWCKANCKGLWHSDKWRGEFCFSDEDDAMRFRLVHE